MYGEYDRPAMKPNNSTLLSYTHRNVIFFNVFTREIAYDFSCAYGPFESNCKNFTSKLQNESYQAQEGLEEN